MKLVRKGKVRKKMTESITEVAKGGQDSKYRIHLLISRDEDTAKLKIFIKAPLVAEIIRKMTPGNYSKEGVSAVYKDLLMPILKPDGTPDPKAADNFVTRPAVKMATKKFVASSEFNWNEGPSTILLFNPDKLAEGYTITIKVDEPVAHDTLKTWGKNFMDGCKEIITNARPFQMHWVMDKTE